ncbi:MAG: SDR family NAD(P)-dependent oxidoreductase [Dokdonella sp.]
MSAKTPGTAIVIGASTGLGRALANALALKQHPLLLVASDQRDLDALAADLALRHGVPARALGLDLGREADPGAAVLAALRGLPAPDALLLPVGYSRHDDDFTLGVDAIGNLLAVNLHAPLAIVHALLPTLVEAHATVVLFGSVAAERGRGRNVVYAAAKRALLSLAESLRQRYRTRELRVQVYQLGFMQTNLTHGMKLPLPVADPDDVADTVVRRLRRGNGVRYLPRWWALIAFIIRGLPLFVFRRMKD